MSETSPVRLRFAPSPTGQLHVGGLRTALYNYFFVRKNKGIFILRIEDTDQKRFVPGAAESLVTILDTMGMHQDEGVFIENGTLIQKGTYGPYIQSERLPLYQEYVQKLIESEKAYYCFCSVSRLSALREEQTKDKLAPRYDKHCLGLSTEEIEERLEAKEPYVIRLNVDTNRGDIVFDDLVRGRVSINARDVDDHVLMKSDGFPTYHLANVVDDHLMHITHVIRAEEWISSTPKHILIYEALEFSIPQFAHLPLLLNPDKSKLSKRQGDVAVEDYLKKGYLKETLINFIALLGWNPGAGSTQEIFTLDELVEKFDLTQVHKAGAVFDLKKLDWMNTEYIKKLSLDELYARGLPFLSEKEFFKAWVSRQTTLSGEEKESFVKRVLRVEQDRLTKLSDIGDNNPFFFVDTLTYETSMLHWKQNTPLQTKEALDGALETLSALTLEEWAQKETIEKVLMDKAGEKRGDFLWPLRVALTGAERSPSPFDVAWVLGQDESLRRIESALAKLA
ncbi:MAG: glutamate--tRNA ligase [Candidatus Moranbacteria bacterium]|nr:glutamate--tRNA ligase [Candidatus Moranbacteria bacterium]MDD3965100.1 glutamate--tRNA ligase [Candidatus Moranbacteria bacterium]